MSTRNTASGTAVATAGVLCHWVAATFGFHLDNMGVFVFLCASFFVILLTNRISGKSSGHVAFAMNDLAGFLVCIFASSGTPFLNWAGVSSNDAVTAAFFAFFLILVFIFAGKKLTLPIRALLAASIAICLFDVEVTLFPDWENGDGLTSFIYIRTIGVPVVLAICFFLTAVGRLCAKQTASEEGFSEKAGSRETTL